MSKPLRDNATVAIQLVQRFRNMIQSVFNKQFFGIYEAVVEQINTANGTADIRITDLDDLAMTDVRIMVPFVNTSGHMSVPLVSGTHVIVAFRAYKLGKPVIIGQIPSLISPRSFTQDRIIIQNGNASVSIGTDGSIILTGSTITANGEDLTKDDTGLL